MLWAVNATAAPPPDGNRSSAARVFRTIGPMNPGWSKYGPILSISGASPPTDARAPAMSSTYCVQLEYELYGDVTKASARCTPSSAIRRIDSARKGCQLRLPQ